jgi:hypothetical protein
MSEDTTLPELPEPWNTIDGELWGQNVTFEVYTADQMRAYAKQAAEAERERCIGFLMGLHEQHKALHNYFHWAAIQLRERGTK